MNNKILKLKKSPSQDRSRETVQLILNATMKLLDSNGLEGVTTNHIAREAGLSVASVYQYFPNKQTILYTLFQQWLELIVDKFDRAEEYYYLKTPWTEFFLHIVEEIFDKSFYSYKVEVQLNRAMASSRELKKMERKHANIIAKRIAEYLKGYGSSWPENKLKKLGLLIYEFNDVVYRLTEEQSDEDRKQTIGWCTFMAYKLINECFK